MIRLFIYCAVLCPQWYERLFIGEDLFKDLIDYITLIVHLVQVQCWHIRYEKATDVVTKLHQAVGKREKQNK